eukprot:8824031-Alexandrium_andersonii.AAC.1
MVTAKACVACRAIYSGSHTTASWQVWVSTCSLAAWLAARRSSATASVWARPSTSADMSSTK